MAIFGILDIEPEVQVADKTRLRATQSFISKGEANVTLIEIEPEATSGFVDVTGSSNADWYLDWSYAGISRTVTVSVRITTDGAPVTTTKTIEILSSADDKLFTKDGDIMRYESEILDLLPIGFASFNYMHRKVRNLILNWFDEQGYRSTDGSKITVDQVLDTSVVIKWSESWVLSLVYNDNSNSVDDKFADKSKFYDNRARDARDRAVFELDFDNSGEITAGEKIVVQSNRIYRT